MTDEEEGLEIAEENWLGVAFEPPHWNLPVQWPTSKKLNYQTMMRTTHL